MLRLYCVCFFVLPIIMSLKIVIEESVGVLCQATFIFVLHIVGSEAKGST